MIKQDLIIFITPNIIDNTKNKNQSKHASKKSAEPLPEESNVNLGGDYETATDEPAPESTDEVDDEAVGEFLDEIGQ